MRIGPLPTPQMSPLFEANPIAKTQIAPKTEAAGLGGPSQGFGKILGNAVGEVEGKMQAAGTETTKLLTGETTNVHQAVIAMQEASVAFSLMVEVRNKLVEGYQELMRMQV